MAYEFYYKEENDVSLTATIPSNLVTLSTLNFTPQKYTKFIIMACADVSGPSLQACLNGLRLTVDGVDECDVGGVTEISLMAFKTATVGVQVTVVLKAQRDSIAINTSLAVKNIRIVVIGVEDWILLEQTPLPTTLSTVSTDQQTVLMEHSFHADISDCLIFSYVELRTSINHSCLYFHYIDAITNSDNILSEFLANYKSYYGATSTCWTAVSSVRMKKLPEALTKLVWSASRADGTNSPAIRRMRTVFVPMSSKGILACEDKKFLDYQYLSYDTDSPNKKLETVIQQPIAVGVTNLLLCSYGAGSKQIDRYCKSEVTFKNYNGAAITISSQDYFNKRTSGGQKYVAGTQKICFKAFAPSQNQLGTTKDFYISSSFNMLVTPSTGDTLFVANLGFYNLQFDQIVNSVGVVEADPTINETYNIRTLVEINLRDNILRYSLEDDVYLFENDTPQNIIDYWNNGQIDDESMRDFNKDGEILLQALQAGDTALAEQAILNTATGALGLTPSITNEYRTRTNYKALYERGVVSEVNTSEEFSDLFMGVSEPGSVTIRIYNGNNQFTSLYSLDKLFGADLKVRFYDKENNDLRSVFCGKITDINGLDVIEITAMNQSLEVLSTEYKPLTVKDIYPYNFSRQKISDDENAAIPVFFGYAKRLTIPHVDKSFGSVGYTPNFIDAYSDYIVGGVPFDTEFRTVVPIVNPSPTGVYTDWATVNLYAEFESSEYWNRKIELMSIADDIEAFGPYWRPALPNELRSIAYGAVISNYQSIKNALSTAATNMGRVFTRTINKIGRLATNSDPSPFTFDDILYPNILNNFRYKAKGKSLSSIRFAAFLMDTPTNTGLLGMFHDGVVFTGDNITVEYPAYTPIIDINSIVGISPSTTNYVKGLDYITERKVPRTIQESSYFPRGPEWIGNSPEASPIITQSTPVDVVRTTGYDFLTANAGVTAQVINILGVTKGFTPYTKGYHFNVRSSTENRVLEDVIDWSPIPLKRGEYTFNGTLANLEGLSMSTIQELSGHQVKYASNNTCIEVMENAPYYIGFLASNEPNIKFSQNGYVSFRQIFYVSTNEEGVLKGVLVSRNDTVGGYFRGFRVDILDAASAGVVGGSATDMVARFRYGRGTAANGTLVCPVVLNDGGIHKIEIRLDQTNVSQGQNIQLVVDDESPVYASEGSNFPIDATAVTEYRIFKDTDAGSGLGNFAGRLYEFVLTHSGIGIPAIGETYGVSFEYRKESYSVDWKFLNLEASNPIQGSGDKARIVAGDFKFTGAGITPATLTGNIVGSTSTSWINGPGNLGNVLRINTNLVNTVSGWTLDSSQLGIDTTLATINIAEGNDGRIEFADNASLRIRGDFSLYICASWRGGKNIDTLLIAKENDANAAYKIPYGIGMRSGKAWGTVQLASRNSIIDLIGSTPIDDGQFHVILLERKGHKLYLYVDGNLEASKTDYKVARHTDSDYGNTGSNKLVVASTKYSLARWQGDIAFFGLCGFAGEAGFARMQSDAFLRGIKGCWGTGFDGNTTILHVPMIEGSGTSVYNRNLHRNFAFAIKMVLCDPIVGLGESADGKSFDTAMKILDDLGLNCDFVTRGDTPQYIDILNNLLIVRGMRLKKNSANQWQITVEQPTLTSMAAFGYNDGFYNNIIDVLGLKYESSDRAIKELVLEYNLLPNNDGNLTYFSRVKRNVLSYGIVQKVIQNPYIYDHITADKVADYLAKRLRHRAKILTIRVGQIGRALKSGDVIQVTVPHLNINNESYIIDGLERSLGAYTLTLSKWDNEIHTYDAGAIEEDVTIGVGNGS